MAAEDVEVFLGWVVWGEGVAGEVGLGEVGGVVVELLLLLFAVAVGARGGEEGGEGFG